MSFVGMPIRAVCFWRILVASLFKREFAVFLLSFWDKMVRVYAATDLALVVQFFDSRIRQFPKDSVNAFIVFYRISIFQLTHPEPTSGVWLHFNTLQEVFRDES